MGASLARMEIRIFLEELMRRHPYFALAGQPTTLFNAWESVPVVFTANATTTSRDNHEH